MKSGRTRLRQISNSRRVIEWINTSLRSVQALGTSIYSAGTEQFCDLEQQRRLTAPFDFLLDTIKPPVIVVRGTDAVWHIS